MKIFIDKNYCCHTTNDGGDLREIECNDFDGYCSEYIEGHRYIPRGETWTNEKGTIFTGKMVAAYKPFDMLMQIQRDYERELAQAARILLGEVSV